MSERKPFEMPVESWVDAQIRDAQSRGLFDDLAGKGAPLPRRDPTDPDWWLKQKLVAENLELPLPPTLQLKKDARAQLAAIRGFSDEGRVREALHLLNEKIRKANRLASSGPPSDLSVVDIEAFVERWREAH